MTGLLFVQNSQHIFAELIAKLTQFFCFFAVHHIKPYLKSYLFTTFTGVPSKNALMLDTVQSIMRWRLSLGAQLM